MKKFKVLLIGLCLLAIFSQLGCARGRERKEKIQGWEYIRIEKKVPRKDCVYKVQEACGEKGAKCYNTFKKRAKLFGANTVVVTEENRSWQQRGSDMSGTWRGDEVVTMLADYYACPEYMPVEQK